MPAVADAVEARHAVVAAAHRLAVDDARARAQAGQGLDDQREAVCQVIARPAIELDPEISCAHPFGAYARRDAPPEAYSLSFRLAVGPIIPA